MNNAEVMVKKIWESKDKRCVKCKEERSSWKNFDVREGHYSNMLIGFGYDDIEKIETPIDILIVAEGHSGKHWPKNQEDFNEVVNHMKKHYLYDKEETFHQISIRNIIKEFNKRRFKWYFTDLIKCFVFTGKRDKKKENFNLAMGNCINHLKMEIDFLNPKIVLMLGRRVQNSITGYLGIVPLKEKSQTERNLNYVSGVKRYFLYSIFPAQRTVDLWIKEGNRKRLIEKVEEILKS